MRVLLDARTVSREFSGVGFYVLELVRAFAASKVDHEFHLLVHGKSLLREQTLDARFRFHEAMLSPESHPWGEFWEELVLPRRARRLGADVLHGPAFLIPTRRTRVPKVVTIHDLVAFTHPKTIPAKYALYMRALIRRATRAAIRVITVSESVRQEVVARFAIDPARVIAIPHGVSERFRPADSAAIDDARRRHRLERPYLLFVGNLEPRKNLPGLVRAFRLVRERWPTALDLAVAGQVAWKSASLVEELRAADVRDSVKLLGYVPTADLPALYSGAAAFVFPTHWEGFGMPVLEALACGTPVVASRIPSIVEVAGDVVRFVDPENPESIARGIIDAIDGRRSRSEIAAKGIARAAQFTWSASAEATLAVYESAGGRGA